LYAQLLIAASFAIAAYQDFRERAVLDLVWIPAAVGVAYSIYWAFPNLEFPVLKLAIVGGIALAFVLLGGVGQADAIGLALIAGDPYQLSPILPLVGGAIVAVAHIGYEYLSGNARGVRTVPLEKFLREQRWIPKAIVADGTRTDVSNDVNDIGFQIGAGRFHVISVRVDDQVGVEGEPPTSQRVEECQVLGGRLECRLLESATYDHKDDGLDLYELSGDVCRSHCAANRYRRAPSRGQEPITVVEQFPREPL